MSPTLHVRVDTEPERSDLTNTLETIDSVEDVAADDSVLSVESLETLGRIFRPTILELLGAIVEHEPESIRALARSVGRNPPEVLENVHELVDYGLVELEDNGAAKRPVLWYDEIEIGISLTRSEDASDDAAVE